MEQLWFSPHFVAFRRKNPCRLEITKASIVFIWLALHKTVRVLLSMWTKSLFVEKFEHWSHRMQCGRMSRELYTQKCSQLRIVFLSPKFHSVYLVINQMRNSTKKHTILTSFVNALTVIEVLKDLKLNQMLTITEAHSSSSSLNSAEETISSWCHLSVNNVARKTNLPVLKLPLTMPRAYYVYTPFVFSIWQINTIAWEQQSVDCHGNKTTAVQKKRGANK